jgi:hypothetical protein
MLRRSQSSASKSTPQLCSLQTNCLQPSNQSTIVCRGKGSHALQDCPVLHEACARALAAQHGLEDALCLYHLVMCCGRPQATFTQSCGCLDSVHSRKDLNKSARRFRARASTRTRAPRDCLPSGSKHSSQLSASASRQSHSRTCDIFGCIVSARNLLVVSPGDDVVILICCARGALPRCIHLGGRSCLVAAEKWQKEFITRELLFSGLISDTHGLHRRRAGAGSAVAPHARIPLSALSSPRIARTRARPAMDHGLMPLATDVLCALLGCGDDAGRCLPEVQQCDVIYPCSCVVLDMPRRAFVHLAMLDDTLMQRVAHLTSVPTRRQLNTMRESHGALPKDYFERVDTHLRQAMSELALTHKSSLLSFAGGDAGVISSDGYDEACREYAKRGLFNTAVGDIWLLVLAHLFDVIVEIHHLSDAGVQTLTMDPFTAGLSTGRSCSGTSHACVASEGWCVLSERPSTRLHLAWSQRPDHFDALRIDVSR